jgi:hypothetical protein
MTIELLSNIFIPETCTGELSVVASIEEIRENVKNSDSQRETIEGSKSYTNVIIDGNDSYEMILSTTTVGEILRCIPAFYDSGIINVNATVSNTDDPDSEVDITFDLIVEIDDAVRPSWYPYSLERISDPTDAGKYLCSSVLTGLITSPRINVVRETMGDNTNNPVSFTMNAWKGIRPIVNNILPQKSVIAGCLPDVTFRLTCYNNLSSAITFSSIEVSISIGYQANCTLGNLGSKSASDYCQLYWDPLQVPGDSNTDEDVGVDRYLWAIVDGYEGGTGTTLQEIVKVFGYFLKTNGSAKELNTVVLEPISATGGTNYPPVVYRTAVPILPRLDNTRMTYRGPSSGEYAWPVTQELICKDERFLDITVQCKKVVETTDDGTQVYLECSPGDEDAEFHITTEIATDIPETTIENGLTKDDIDGAIQTLKFFNIEIPYLGCIEQQTSSQSNDDYATVVSSYTHIIQRSNINKVFYDTISTSYKKSVVFISMRNDVEPFILIRINNNQLKESLDWIPIYNGKSITFSESLKYCTDGVRSRDVWFFGDKGRTGVIPNTVEVRCTIPRVYRVNVEIQFDEYVSAYIHKYAE